VKFLGGNGATDVSTYSGRLLKDMRTETRQKQDEQMRQRERERERERGNQIEKETENGNRETDRTSGGRGKGADIKMKSHGLINTWLSRVIELSRDTEPRGAEFTKGTDHQHTLDPRRACTRARTRAGPSPAAPARARIPLAERATVCIPLSRPPPPLRPRA